VYLRFASLLTGGLILLLPLCLHAESASGRVYQAAMQMAAQHQYGKAIVALQAASAMLPASAVWQQRMLAAADLLQMQQGQQPSLVALNNDYIRLAAAYITAHPPAEAAPVWPTAVLATVLPGAGHAWLGRWHDALVAALFVWPLLLLTLWARRRRMGPVTVFFAGLTLWLWSGTVFSAISLAERGSMALYALWWQQLWQASALPGTPW